MLSFASTCASAAHAYLAHICHFAYSRTHTAKALLGVISLRAAPSVYRVAGAAATTAVAAVRLVGSAEAHRALRACADLAHSAPARELGARVLELTWAGCEAMVCGLMSLVESRSTGMRECDVAAEAEAGNCVVARDARFGMQPGMPPDPGS